MYKCVGFNETTVSCVHTECLLVFLLFAGNVTVIFGLARVCVSGSIQNRSRCVQAKEAEGSTGLFHFPTGGVLL